MKFLKQLPAFILLVLTIFAGNSCKRDVDRYVPDNNNIGQSLYPSPVEASVQGKIIDENNLPVAGATVKSGTNSTITDSRGLFSFKHITIDKYASFVTVETAGYFKGIRTFSATAGSVNFVKIKLKPKTLAGTVEASVGGAVTLYNDAVITLLSNSVIVKATGLAYTGTINVYATNIDPTATDIPETVPGSFQAIDTNNYRVILKSYGMLAVQLEGQAGELLQIASNKTARLRFAIPAPLVAEAPANIALWSLNETDGLWKQEGQATKSGNYYEGDVSHFTFWNCDVSFNSIYLELTVETANGALQNTPVKITRVSNGASTYGFTDSLGHVGGMVFSNELLTLEIQSNCYETVFSQQVGPFSTNTNLGNITVGIPAQFSLAITGEAANCAGAAVTTGVASIYWAGQYFSAPIVNGSFSTIITRCSAGTGAVEITLFDYATTQQSNVFLGDATGGNISTGTIPVCGAASEEFIDFYVDTLHYIYTAPFDTLRQFLSGTTNIGIYGIKAQNSIPVNFTFTASNIAAGSVQSLMDFTTNYVNSGQTFPGGPIDVIITEYGNVGEFISGQFSGSLISGFSAPYTTYALSCSFRIRRQF